MRYYFVFTNTPDTPSFLRAIYPESMLQEAIQHVNRGGGYLELRTGTWKGFGEVPEKNELVSI